MAFHEIPPELADLRPLEERLVSLRIPFMQIRELPRGRQLSIKGNVVNVPVDICPTINCLSRNLGDIETIPVKLKRRKQYKTAPLNENIRPTTWLVQSSTLVKQYTVQGK